MDSSPDPRADLTTLEGLRGFDTATIFNAVVETMGASQGGKELENGVGQPENYTGPEIRSLLPNLGRVVGYVFTSEWTPLEPTAESVPWESYYLALPGDAQPHRCCHEGRRQPSRSRRDVW